MRKVFTLLFALAVASTSFAQTVFYKQSFEKPWDAKLSHVFDDGFEDYAKRDTTMSGMDFTAFGKDGDYYIGLEDLDAESTSPSDAVVTISIDSIDISSKKDLEVILALAGNPSSNKYDEASLGNGDSISIEAKIDNGFWQQIGFFCPASGSNSGPMYLDLNNNKLGGDMGEPSLGPKFTDYTFGVTGTGSMMYIRVAVRLDSGDEEIALDNVRVQGEASTTVNDSTTVSFSAASYKFDEDAGTVSVDVTADKVVGAGSVTATVSAVDGTAANGTNFSFTSSTVTFTSSDLTETVTLSITDDMVYGGDLDFELELAAGTGMVKLGVGTAKVTIEDNEYPTVSLKDLRMNDANGVSLYDGETVWSGGIVNTSTSFNTGAVNIYFQSAGYGIGTFISGLSYVPQEGDSIIIRGRVSRFNGLTQFSSADSFRVVSSGNPVVPEVVTALTEAKEGVLVKLEGLTIVDNKDFPADGSNGDVEVTDGTNTYALRIDRDTDIDGRDTFNVEFDLMGIITQYDNDDNVYDKGYQILPRNWWDFDLSEYDRTIAELRMNDTNDLPILRGRTVRTRGIINNDVNFRDGGFTLSMESEGWGMSMFDFDMVPEAVGLNVGDSVEVLGTMGEFNGLSQITNIDTIIVRTTGNTIVPEIVTELNETTESRLVTYQNLSLVDTAEFQTNPTRDYSADVTDGTVTFTMRVNFETDIRFMAAPMNAFHLTGIGGQFDNSDAPFDAGYQLMPRSKADIDILVGLNNIAEVEGTVFPNPTTGMLTVQAADEVAQVTVFNLLGTEVLNNTVVGNTLDISTLENGVYMIEGITNSGATFTTRVVKR